MFNLSRSVEVQPSRDGFRQYVPVTRYYVDGDVDGVFEISQSTYETLET